jgi:hypothetical protein
LVAGNDEVALEARRPPLIGSVVSSATAVISATIERLIRVRTDRIILPR